MKSARKPRREEEDYHPGFWQELGGIALAIASLYAAWCVVAPQQAGSLGFLLGVALWRVFGQAAVPFCGLVLGGAAAVIAPDRMARWTTRIAAAGLGLLFLDVETVIDMVDGCGGWIGHGLAGTLVEGTGVLGAWLSVVALGMGCLLVLLRVPPRRMLGHTATLLQRVLHAVPRPSLTLKIAPAALATLRFSDRRWDREGRPGALDASGLPVTVLPHAPQPQMADEAEAAEGEDEEDDTPPWDPPAAEEKAAEAPAPEATAAPAPTKMLPPRPPAPSRPTQLDMLTDFRTHDTEYRLPVLELLNRPEAVSSEPQRDHSRMLVDTLQSFGVSATATNVVRGPTVTRYELTPARGVKVASITTLANDIALALAAQAIRLEAPIPGKSAIGIEVPNDRAEIVCLREILEAPEYRKGGGLPLALGRDISGRVVVSDLLKMPHLLIAGSTGSGKSVCLNTIIASILYRATPLEVQMVMVDIKRVELSVFEGIPHLAATSQDPNQRIVTDPKTGTLALKYLCDIMMQRYDLFTQSRVRNIGEYNKKADTPLPFLVIIIDELAELMQVSARAVEGHIQRIAQMGRAAGLHLILATQRPSVDVITGTIKANFPARIAFAVKSQVDSRTILDRGGADKLLGRGDMLFSPTGSDFLRVQGAYVDISEMERVIDFWKGQAAPENLTGITVEAMVDEAPSAGAEEDEGEDEELIQEALKVIRLTRLASASNLQRKMKLGYPKAAR
ncbi:MAG: FtsK/SpoIIIE family DNA translocase, partial [Candidatus Xenobia bacterium]